jgi:hypothetical protein
MSTGPGSAADLPPHEKSSASSACGAHQSRTARREHNPARDATARTAGPFQYRVGATRPAWLAGPEAGSLTRQPKAGQVGGGPPLTRPARECQAGRLVRVTAMQARWVFRACPAGPTGPALFTRRRDFPTETTGPALFTRRRDFPTETTGPAPLTRRRDFPLRLRARLCLLAETTGGRGGRRVRRPASPQAARACPSSARTAGRPGAAAA